MADPKVEIILPNAKHDLAANFKNDLRHMDSFVPEHMRSQFYPAFMASVNDLKPNTEYRSIFIAAMNCAVLGLLPGAARGHAYIVPYKGKAQVIVGYKGYMELGYRSGHLGVIHQPRIVFRGDEFKMWSDEKGHHFHHPFDLEKQILATRQNVLAAYCSYTTKDGLESFAIIPKVQIDEIDTGENVWASDYGPMCMKSALRAAAKTWRLTSDLAMADRVDETGYAANEQFEAATASILSRASAENRDTRLIAQFRAKMRSITPVEEEWVPFCRWLLADPSITPEHMGDAAHCNRVLDELDRRNQRPEDLVKQSGVRTE